MDISSESIKWFEIFNFESSNGILEVKLNEQLKPYLLNIKNKFVLAQLDSILNLNGYYSKRFYLLLAQYKKMQKCKYDLIKLHKILSTPNSLQKLYSNFKSRVLDFSMNEINRNTEQKIEYENTIMGAKSEILLLDKRINAYVSDINLILTAINMKSEELLKDTKRLFDLSIVVQKANREKCKI